MSTESDAPVSLAGHRWPCPRFYALENAHPCNCGKDAEGATPTAPTGQWCPIGPLNAHTYNYERDECIWCGPNALANKPGRWVPIGDGLDAWSATSHGASNA